MRATNLFFLSQAATFGLYDLPGWRRKIRRHAAVGAPWWQGRYTLILVEEQVSAGWHGPARRVRTVHCVGPDQAELPALPAGADGKVLSFMDTFFRLSGHEQDRLLAAALFHCSEPALALPVPPDVFEDKLSFLLDALEQEYTAADSFRELVLHAYARAILIHCVRLKQQAPTPARTSLAINQFGFGSLLPEKPETGYGVGLSGAANLLEKQQKWPLPSRPAALPGDALPRRLGVWHPSAPYC